jgi:hypothetical protein
MLRVAAAAGTQPFVAAPIRQTIMRAAGAIDEDGSRYLLGDAAGALRAGAGAAVLRRELPLAAAAPVGGRVWHRRCVVGVAAAALGCHHRAWRSG